MGNQWPDELDRELKKARPWIEAFARSHKHPQPAGVYQDACIACWRHSDCMVRCRDFRAWLTRVVKNHVRSWYRAKSKCQLVCASTLGIELDDMEDMESFPSDDAFPNEELYRAVDRLPEPQADVVLACKFGNESLSEYSQRKSVSLDTAKSRLKRALKRLRADSVLRDKVLPST